MLRIDMYNNKARVTATKQPPFKFYKTLRIFICTVLPIYVYINESKQSTYNMDIIESILQTSLNIFFFKQKYVQIPVEWHLWHVRVCVYACTICSMKKKYSIYSFVCHFPYGIHLLLAWFLGVFGANFWFFHKMISMTLKTLLLLSIVKTEWLKSWRKFSS